MTQPSTRTLTRLGIGLVALSLLLVGCDLRGYRTVPPTTSTHYPGGPVYSDGVISTGPAVAYVGDLALTVYAPAPSAYTADTVSFNVMLRRGGAFGPVVVDTVGFGLDAWGVGAVDLAELPYGLYDVSITGADLFGSAVSYAATTVNISESYGSLVMQLEPVTFAGDVVLDLYEPDGGLYENPVDTIDYTLYELDPLTGNLVFVEAMVEVPVDPWNPVVIAQLELGDYYLELSAYDLYGYRIYDWWGDFGHDAETTFLPIDLWYAM